MIKYFYRVSFGFVGCESTGLLEAKNEEAALEIVRELAIENAESFGYYQDEDAFGDLDTVGAVAENLTEEEEAELEFEGYGEVGQLDYYAEVYNSEKHDGLYI
jgi:hypothetical protein|tara:strand:+ start:391 stop:699 length:309 start_codon:yes stop_codon:yes gene_type:complete